mgnify:CR=1 FL=1|jgi:hypothetical protein
MAERKTFLNKNFNVNELKKIYKQIGGTKVTGLKKNQLVNKIVSLEKKNFSQNGGFGLNDIVNFFGNSNSINILDELEPQPFNLDIYGGDSGNDSTETESDDSEKSKRRRGKKQGQQGQQKQQGQDAGYNFYSDTSGLNFSDSSILTDSSLNLDDSTFDLDTSFDSLSSINTLSDSSY